MEIDNLINASQENLRKMAKLYTSRKKYSGKLSYGLLVELYFKTKHGFKVIHPTATSKLLWSFSDDDLVLVRGIGKVASGRKLLAVESFPDIDEKVITTLVQEIKEWSNFFSEIIDANLKKLQTPYYLVPLLRKEKTRRCLEGNSPKIGRNDTCPCESGLKYKYCCGK